MKKWYFTFGFGQPHEGCYHIIKTNNSEDARDEMFKRFGTKWAMQYDSAEEAGVEEFHLREIK